jgi:hypothetical protein
MDRAAVSDVARGRAAVRHAVVIVWDSEDPPEPSAWERATLVQRHEIAKRRAEHDAAMEKLRASPEWSAAEARQAERLRESNQRIEAEWKKRKEIREAKAARRKERAERWSLWFLPRDPIEEPAVRCHDGVYRQATMRAPY